MPLYHFCTNLPHNSSQSCAQWHCQMRHLASKTKPADGQGTHKGLVKRCQLQPSNFAKPTFCQLYQLCQAWSCPCPRHKWADVCKTNLLPAKLSRLGYKWLVLLGLVLKAKLIFPIFRFEFGLCSLPFSILWPLSECLSESLILNFDHAPTFSINVCPPQKCWFGLFSKYINKISIKNIIQYFK